MKIAIYLSDSKPMGYPFDNSKYFEGYAELTAISLKKLIEIYIVRHDSYVGNTTFSSAWKFVDGRLEDVGGPLTVDLIYAKANSTYFNPNPGEKIINNPEFDALGWNKWKTYEVLREFSTPTFQVTKDGWPNILESITTEKAVLKPVEGLGGQGVVIDQKEVLQKIVLDENTEYLIQNFIDSSDGVPGCMAGIHDLRILMFNNKPCLSQIRSPKAGTYISNISQGGAVQVIPVENLPKSAHELVKKVDSKLAHFGSRIYSIDLMYENGVPFVGEINTHPGLPTLEGPEYREQFFNLLTDLFLSVNK